MNKNAALTSLAWGAFFIWIGLSWIASEYYNVSMGAYVALGVGAILISLNAARILLKLKPSKFSLFVGILALAFGGASAAGFELPLWQAILILIGLFIIAEAAAALAKSK